MKREIMQVTHAQALLYAYPRIVETLDEYDCLIKLMAHKTFYSTESCEKLCNEIIEMQNKLNEARSIKQGLDTVLSRFEPDELKYIRFRYFSEKSLAVGDPDLDTYKRNYHRRANKYTYKFAEYCSWYGFDEKWFNDVALWNNIVYQYYVNVKYAAWKSKTENKGV